MLGNTLPIDRGIRKRGVSDGCSQSLALALPKIFSLFFQSLSIGNIKIDLSITRLSQQLVSIKIISWHTRDTGSYTQTKSFENFNSSPCINPDCCPTEASFSSQRPLVVPIPRPVGLKASTKRYFRLSQLQPIHSNLNLTEIPGLLGSHTSW